VTRRPRHLVPPTARELFTRLGAGLGAGAAVGALTSLDRPSTLPLAAAAGAWVGACVYLATVPLGLVLDPVLHRLSGLRHRLVLALAFFFAGIVGWWVAVETLPWVSFGRLRLGTGAWATALAVAGGIGVLVGLVLAAWESLTERLAASVEKVKELEFAERELATARAIQERLLPPGIFRTAGCRITAANRPAGYVAGDFYDYFRLPDGRLAVAVADVAGKGTGASLIMAAAKAMLPFVVGENGAAQALGELSRRLSTQLGPREFVALALAYFLPSTGEGELANAGLPDPYLLRPGRPSEPLLVPGPRLPIGTGKSVAYRSLPFRLLPGERLLFATDGLPEAPTAAGGEPIGYARFAELIQAATEETDPATALLARLEAETAWPRADDWTLLVLERT
jgi:hypothetical protein